MRGQQKRFRYCLLLSIIFHILLLFLIHRFFLKRGISFRQEEDKIVSVQLVKTAVKQNSVSEGENKHIQRPETASGFKNSIQPNLQLEPLKQALSFPTKTEETKWHSGSYFKKKFSAAPPTSDLYDSPNDLFEPTAPSLAEEGITFTEGESRKLLFYDTEKIRQLKFISDKECRLLLSINENGYITTIELIESTGDLLLDNEISSIVGNWIFEKGAVPQKAILKLKYFIK